MKINTLRYFDIWIGRPVCWLLTLIYKIGQLFDKKPGKISTRKILLIKLFGFAYNELKKANIKFLGYSKITNKQTKELEKIENEMNKGKSFTREQILN